MKGSDLAEEDGGKRVGVSESGSGDLVVLAVVVVVMGGGAKSMAL